MAEILIVAMPPIGHVSPLLSVAAGLIDRGDRVTVLTSATHAERVRAVGATPAAIPAEADFDLSRLDIDFPGRAETTGVARVNFDITHLFVAPMPHQARALSEVLAHNRFDAVIVDAAFLGVLPLLLGDRAGRPPVLAYTTTPLMITSRDTAPGGLGMAPSSSWPGRLRNRALTVLAQKVLLRESQRAAEDVVNRLGAGPLRTFVLDAGLLADRYIAPTIPEFDYPRSDLPTTVRYVGAVHPAPSSGVTLPSWWEQLDTARPIVHVTQGTIDNADLGRLLAPTIAALGGEDVTVIATTGGRPVTDLRIPLPSNVHVAEYIPHDLLLPKVDVMVTNGGYGAVQRALSAGVPLVVAGDTEDKPEVAARVAWAGAGIDLRTGTPSPEAVRTAVRAVLDDDRYGRRARDLAAGYARRDGVAEIAALVHDVIAERGDAAPREVA
ncbi:glycosyltransferase [Mycobacterium sp. CPCC 205372]|uniref:Glycosyltransferase n=1 Tax=Mycobacterium hippophais TaxID=3016340 RepID=A0ABT4PQ66_9MYCO|nr:nucleotide disphospho-sugar-binding domain-containing protein [Mycobacterium hippophais]MCZ8378624.1 glycosyltransferase [Mycobacterium hippophais]